MITFRLGETVAHTKTGTIGTVKGFNSDGVVYVDWNGVYQPMGHEEVPAAELLNLDRLDDADGHFDQVRHIATVAFEAVRKIDQSAKSALDHGWYSEDMKPIFRSLDGLSLLVERIRSEVYRAEFKGSN